LNLILTLMILLIKPNDLFGFILTFGKGRI
jgi:hypothetical protein